METQDENKIQIKIKRLKQEVEIWKSTSDKINHVDSAFSSLYSSVYELHIQQLQHLIDMLEILDENVK